MQSAFAFVAEFPEELLAQQRAAIIVWRLAQGERFTTAEVAEITGMGYVGAWCMMWKIEAVLPPLCQDDEGCWRVRY
jgi:hypothetical protein